MDLPAEHAPLAGSGSLDPGGPIAEALADLWWLMLVLGAAVFALFAVLLIIALVRRHDPAADHSREATHRLTRRWIVAGGVVLPAVVISGVYAATLGAMRAVPHEVSADALTVEIVGHQFWYEVRYPDQQVVTANEVRIPVGQPVSFRLDSADVIHSFWVPELGGKMDLLPERTNTLVLEADEPGRYVSRCAEFCGLQHTRMKLIFHAEPPEDFQDWIAHHQAPADPPTGEAARRGHEVFFEGGCADCHAIDGTTATARDGPDLTHLASRETLGAGTLPNTPENLTDWVRDPQQIKAGAEMPATSLTDDQLQDLLAYLGTLE